MIGRSTKISLTTDVLSIRLIQGKHAVPNYIIWRVLLCISFQILPKFYK